MNSSKSISPPLDASFSLWKAYFKLTKPKVVALIVFTAVVGMLLSSPGGFPLFTFVAATLGIALASASGAAINHVVDQHIDGVMDRTRDRPLPSSQINSRYALAFALLLCALSMGILLLFVNVLTAWLTFISLVGYAVIYTVFLKRSTPQNIVLGGAAGAAPPLLGWTAMTGELNSEALLLFLIIFIWTPPHFWALAIRRREEYAKAGIPMLPVTHGVSFTKLQILLYTLLLLAVTLMPFVIQMSGLIYLAGALALGLGFIYQAVRLYFTKDDPEDRHAVKTFVYSIYYLSLLFAFLLADHYARVFFRTVL